MLTIRLVRAGKKNAPIFRVALIKKTAPPKSGKFLEFLGNYNPRQKVINLKKERIKYWLSQGVQTSLTVHNLLVKEGIIKGPKIKKKLRAKKKEVKPEKEGRPEIKEKGKETKEEMPQGELKKEKKGE